MDEEKREQLLAEFKERLGYYTLSMGRVPKKTYEQFVDFAEKEFCKDYGMAFKHLIDFYFGLIPAGNEHLQIQIEALKKEIDEIKLKLNEPEEEEDTGVRMLNGRVLQRRR